MWSRLWALCVSKDGEQVECVNSAYIRVLPRKTINP